MGTEKWAWLAGSDSSEVTFQRGPTGVFSTFTAPPALEKIDMKYNPVDQTINVFGGSRYISSVKSLYRNYLFQLKIISTCPSGYEPSVSLNSCQKCSSGRYKRLEGNSSCIPCPSNAECSMSNFKYRAGFEPNTDACQPCPINSFKPTVGNYACRQCGPGFIQPITGQTSCQTVMGMKPTAAWTWLGGTFRGDQLSQYGQKDVPGSNNWPGARVLHALAAHDGIIYLFAGNGVGIDNALPDGT